MIKRSQTARTANNPPMAVITSTWALLSQSEIEQRRRWLSGNPLQGGLDEIRFQIHTLRLEIDVGKSQKRNSDGLERENAEVGKRGEPQRTFLVFNIPGRYQ